MRTYQFCFDFICFIFGTLGPKMQMLLPAGYFDVFLTSVAEDGGFTTTRWIKLEMFLQAVIRMEMETAAWT
jgi:hypothetical protein